MATRKIKLTLHAYGEYVVEVDENALKPLLTESGEDFTEEVLEEATDCPLPHFGLGACAPIDAAIDAAGLLNALDVEVENIELVKE